MGKGHVRRTCPAKEDRSNAYAAASLPANHVMGSKVCSPPPVRVWARSIPVPHGTRAVPADNLPEQPKSTYLLLGNVSLADTIIGISIIFGATVENSMRSNQLCIFQLGLLVCPAIVSIFSVALIAIDRYIYILHGLYYQRWFNTTRVRIGIVCIWIIGIILGFMPVTGWTNNDPLTSNCLYVAVYPGELIVFNSILSIIPIVIVAILYCIILLQALKNLRNIKASNASVSQIDIEIEQTSRLRIYRGTNKMTNKKPLNKQDNNKIKRSASFHSCNSKMACPQERFRSKSTDDLNLTLNRSREYVNKIQTRERSGRVSNSSICTVETICTIENSFRRATESSIATSMELPCKKICKVNGPKKWRAVTIVMLTSGSIIITWMPFFIIVILFVYCEEKRTNSRCLHYSTLLSGPIALLAFINSVLNPLIYAWWHKGFKKSIKNHFRRYVQRHVLLKRIFIACLPAMGWTGKTFRDFRCWYIAVFPPSLLIVLSTVVLSVIIMVCLLYILILHSAVKAVNKIRECNETNVAYINKGFDESNNIDERSKTSVKIIVSTETVNENMTSLEMHEMKTNFEHKQSNDCFKEKMTKVSQYYHKSKSVKSTPSKLKAVKTVLLVTFCFLGTWAPYYVAVIMYVKCNILIHGYDCVPLEILTLGPLYLLGVSNSLCDPLIYAWRHSGFKRTLKKMYLKYILKSNI
ncbi:unnamed protein product [Diatraea saccharalis]|uniref:G-protein coupled receptors family 1 profile domain-containing protein n=1 Tax=Diatraea saccharalis TaxID=40085 RepID=A0A9N9WG33_9NEOP|nr:unnamed protein product [Diatraea saccharalis]